MPRAPAEAPLVKKTMTKLKSCTKKYRKAVRAFNKTSANLGFYTGKDTKRRTALYKKTKDANDKANKIYAECNQHLFVLDYMMRSKQVVKDANRVKIEKMVEHFDKDERDWSSNTSSDKKAIGI